jgi:hypothetical protein
MSRNNPIAPREQGIISPVFHPYKITGKKLAERCSNTEAADKIAGEYPGLCAFAEKKAWNLPQIIGYCEEFSKKRVKNFEAAELFAEGVGQISERVVISTVKKHSPFQRIPDPPPMVAFPANEASTAKALVAWWVSEV